MNRRDRAVAIVGDVAERLADPEFVTSRTDGGIWRPLSLSAGYPGVALLFAELASIDARWSSTLHGYMRCSASHVSGNTDAGMFAGLGSFAVAARSTVAGVGGYVSASQNLDHAVMTRLARAVGGDVPRRLSFLHYDLVSGVAGMVRYLLDVDDRGDAVRSGVDWLVRMCLRDGDRPGWWVFHGPNPHVEAPLGGHGNLGVAHGVAGVMVVLARAMLAGVNVADLPRALDTVTQWVWGHARNDEYGRWWPMFVTDDATDRERGNASWCYGTVGIAGALRLASLARNDSAGTAAALNAVDAAVAAAVPLADVGVCHGWAGLAHLLWRMDPVRYESAIDDAIDRVIDAFDASRPFGYACDSSDGPMDHPGFLEGAAGTALVLHRYGTGAAPAVPWDSLLI